MSNFSTHDDNEIQLFPLLLLLGEPLPLLLLQLHLLLLILNEQSNHKHKDHNSEVSPPHLHFVNIIALLNM